MKSTYIGARRLCSMGLNLAAVALLTGGVAVAQTGSMPSSSPSAAGSTGSNSPMNSNNPNSPMSGGMQQGGMSTMPGTGGAGAGSMQDKKFAKAAIAGGLAEIQTSQLALQKSNSDDVKKFAQQMIDDHTKLNTQMMPIAQQLGVTPPTEPEAHDKAVAAKLQALQGDEFDKAYLKAQVKDHMKDDKEFTKESASGQNPQEKDAATQGDQIIKQHLQMAQDIAKTHGATGGGSKSSM